MLFQGTTGRPKGALLTYHGMVNNAYFIGRRVGYHEQDHTYCCVPPLYHCFGNVAGALCAVVFSDTCVFPSRSFDALAALKAVHEHK